MKKLAIVFLLLITHVLRSQDADELSVKYTFNDGNIIDEKSNLAAKVYEVSLVTDRFGNPNCAFFLHGNLGSYINLGTNEKLKPKNGTISLWFKIDHLMPNGKGVEFNPVIFTRSNNGDSFNEAYYIGYDMSTHNIAANTTLSKERQVSVYSADSLTLRKWHHAVVTYDNSFVSFYMDGVLQGKMAKNFESIFLQGDSVIVGNLVSNKNTRFLNGSVDDIEIYGRVLSNTEILSLYNAPNPNKNAVIWKWSRIILLICALVIIGIWLLKRRIKQVVNKEKEKNQLLNHALEQEVKMLKAQMDPHFIFNSLNTILQFIITKENDKAELYLTKFSKLIRKILEGNTKDNISLEDELDILKKYLEIESLRFDKVFKPIIEFGYGIDPNQTYIPHMLIQPFVENAIWHGLRLKEGEKILKIRFEKLDEKILLCVIDDNGIGRKQEGLSKGFEKNSSLAINFIKQRLELMSKKFEMKYSVEIIDKYLENGEKDGTRIELKIPLLKR